MIGLAFALGVAVGACCYHDKISKPKVADAFNRGKAVGVRAAERERELWRYRGAIDAAQGRLSAEPIEIVKRWRVREEGTAGIVYSEIEQQKSSDDSEGDLVRWAA